LTALSLINYRLTTFSLVFTEHLENLKSRIAELEEKEKIFLEQQSKNEAEFGQKRARFREMFLQKEGWLYIL